VRPFLVDFDAWLYSVTTALEHVYSYIHTLVFVSNLGIHPKNVKACFEYEFSWACPGKKEYMSVRITG
jgi:hypothetical protein